MPEPDFSRRTPEEDRADIIEALVARGVPRERLVDEPDLGGVAADVNVRGLERVTPSVAAEAAGLSATEARRVWLSMGVALGDDDVPTFTPEEARILRFYADARELFGEAMILQVLRVMGSAFNRIAEAEVSGLRLAYEKPFLDSGASFTEVAEGYDRLSRMILPEVEASFAALHRLQLARASQRAWAIDQEGQATLASVAIGFADLADFTMLSTRLSPGELAVAVEDFEERVGELVTVHGGRLVKLIGDEAMFVADDLLDGVETARRLAAELPGDERLPAVRVGLAYGQVVTRDGDYYGSVVNLAHRLVGLAEPGEVVVSEPVAIALGEPGACTALGPVSVKGFPEPVLAYGLA